MKWTDMFYMTLHLPQGHDSHNTFSKQEMKEQPMELMNKNIKLYIDFRFQIPSKGIQERLTYKRIGTSDMIDEFRNRKGF